MKDFEKLSEMERDGFLLICTPEVRLSKPIYVDDRMLVLK